MVLVVPPLVENCGYGRALRKERKFALVLSEFLSPMNSKAASEGLCDLEDVLIALSLDNYWKVPFSSD